MGDRSREATRESATPERSREGQPASAGPEVSLPITAAIGARDPRALLALQRQVGNRSTRRLLSSYPRTGGSPVVQRNGESAALLEKMAQPKVEKGPEVEVQKDLVKLLEGKISEENAKKHEGFNQDNLFLGGIELTSVPVDPADDRELLKTSRLVRMKVNSLGRDDHSLVELIDATRKEKPSASEMIVRNTLSTMLDAHQIDYLRKSGFVGQGWKILIEVHYYRRRTKAGHQMHKDTLGQTLFVNLNYHADQAIGGPEYIVNPPAQEKHDAFTSVGGQIRDKDPSLTGGGLPDAFRADMAAVRKSLTAKHEGQEMTAHAPDVPAYGYVAFVDELIHHNTPMLGGREVTRGTVEFYLTNHHKEHFTAAQKAYEEYEKRGLVYSFYGFGSYLPKELQGTMWEKLIPALRSRKLSDMLGRKALLDAGMPGGEIDGMLSENSSSYSKVSLPTVERGSPQPINPERGKKLIREMSSRNLRGELPADTPGDNRTFFRTWVRAVRAD